jgi:hypothetical protein
MSWDYCPSDESLIGENMWLHIISVDTEWSAGTIGLKKFKKPLSNQALTWFDNKVAHYVIGHLTEKLPRKSHVIELHDSVGSKFFIAAYKDLR